MRQRSTEGILGEKKAAAKSVALHMLLQLLSAGALLWLRTMTGDGALSNVLLILAVVDLAVIPPSLLVLYQRMREIERGELDEARKY